MQFDVKEMKDRLKSDEKQMDIMIKRGVRCPKCDTYDGLKLRTKIESSKGFWYIFYKVECQRCKYEQQQWHDTSADAIVAMQKDMIHE